MGRQYILVFLFVAAGCWALPLRAQQVDTSKIGYVDVDSAIEPQNDMEDFIKPFRDSLLVDMNRVIGITAMPLAAKKPESPLSNLVADVMVWAVNNQSLVGKKVHGAQLGIVNIKGIRSAWGQGDILVKNVFELLPFENQLVLLGLKGKVVQELFHFMAAEGGDGLSGASFVIVNNKAQYCKVNGKRIKPNRIYSLVVPDYIANGGDRYFVLSKSEWREDTGIKIRDAMIGYIESMTLQGKQIQPNTDRRIVYGQ